jgi:hypothetical protein
MMPDRERVDIYQEQYDRNAKELEDIIIANKLRDCIKSSNLEGLTKLTVEDIILLVSQQDNLHEQDMNNLMRKMEADHE